MPHPPLLDGSWFALLALLSNVAFFYLGQWSERRKRVRSSRMLYVVAERAKVVSFTPDEFDQLAKTYSASTEQRHQVIAALFNPPPLTK
jgi:hypothetical protein